MINPPPLPERVEPTVCLIKPKGRDRAGHTARERGRQRQIGKRRKKKTLFISVPLRLPSVYRTWQLVLTSCPLRLIPLLSFHRLSFSPNDEKKRPLGLSLSLSLLPFGPCHSQTWSIPFSIFFLSLPHSHFLFLSFPPVLHLTHSSHPGNSSPHSYKIVFSFSLKATLKSRQVLF